MDKLKAGTRCPHMTGAPCMKSECVFYRPVFIKSKGGVVEQGFDCLYVTSQVIAEEQFTNMARQLAAVSTEINMLRNLVATGSGNTDSGDLPKLANTSQGEIRND